MDASIHIHAPACIHMYVCVVVHSVVKKNNIVTANRMTAFENNFIHPFEHFNRFYELYICILFCCFYFAIAINAQVIFSFSTRFPSPQTHIYTYLTTELSTYAHSHI